MKYKTQIITSLANVPAGYAAATDFVLSSRRVLSKAAVAGEIASAKFMRSPFDIRGPVFYEDAQASAYLNAYYSGEDGADEPEIAVQPELGLTEDAPVNSPAPVAESPATATEPATETLPTEATHRCIIAITVNDLTDDRIDELGQWYAARLRDQTDAIKAAMNMAEVFRIKALVGKLANTMLTLSEILEARRGVVGPYSETDRTTDLDFIVRHTLTGTPYATADAS